MKDKMERTVLSSDTVKAEALRLGFSACGLAPAEPLPPVHAAEFRRWIDEGRHGEMDYLTVMPVCGRTPAGWWRMPAPSSPWR